MSVSLEELALQLLSQLLQGQQAAASSQQLQQVVVQVNNILQSTQALEVAVAALDNANNQAHEVIEVDLNQIQQMLRALSIQIANPQQSRVPVTLPTTPPPGYGGASSSDIADAVWAQPMPNATPFTALEAQDSTMGWLFFASNFNATLPIRGNPGYAVGGLFSEPQSRFSGPTFSSLDFSTILPTDATIFAWATRTHPAAPWVSDVAGMAFERDSLNGAILWYVDLTPEQFRVIKESGGTAVRVAPVWPGLANVTLGASHALVDGLVIAGPMNGVIVTVTTVPPQTGFYPFGSRRSFVHIGGVIFVDDNGEAEHSQTIGLDDQVVVPRSMTSATSAIFRVKSGTVGTVRAWTSP